MMVGSVPQVNKPLPQSPEIKPGEKMPKQKSSKSIFVILAIVAIVILTVAALLGLFWDRLFT